MRLHRALSHETAQQLYQSGSGGKRIGSERKLQSDTRARDFGNELQVLLRLDGARNDEQPALLDESNNDFCGLERCGLGNGYWPNAGKHDERRAQRAGQPRGPQRAEWDGKLVPATCNRSIGLSGKLRESTQRRGTKVHIRRPSPNLQVVLPRIAQKYRIVRHQEPTESGEPQSERRLARPRFSDDEHGPELRHVDARGMQMEESVRAKRQSRGGEEHHRSNEMWVAPGADLRAHGAAVERRAHERAPVPELDAARCSEPIGRAKGAGERDASLGWRCAVTASRDHGESGAIRSSIGESRIHEGRNELTELRLDVTQNPAASDTELERTALQPSFVHGRAGSRADGTGAARDLTAGTGVEDAAIARYERRPLDLAPRLELRRLVRLALLGLPFNEKASAAQAARFRPIRS